MSFEGFARFYAAVAMVIVALSFFPILNADAGANVYGNQGGAFGGLLDVDSSEASLVGEPAFVLLVLVGMLLVATFSTAPGIVGLGSGIAGFADRGRAGQRRDLGADRGSRRRSRGSVGQARPARTRS